MIINDLDGYYIVFDTKNWNTELDTLIIYILLAIEFPHWNYVTTYLLLRPDVTFAASGRSKSLKNTIILLILCQKW